MRLSVKMMLLFSFPTSFSIISLKSKKLFYSFFSELFLNQVPLASPFEARRQEQW